MTPTATWPPATPARSTSPAATPRPSCRPTTPSPPATPGTHTSRSRSRRRAPSRSRPPTRRTGPSRAPRPHHGRRRRRATSSSSGFPSPTRPARPTTSPSPPTTPTATWPPATPARSHFTSSDAQAVLPANYTFTGGRRRDAHLLGHARRRPARSRSRPPTRRRRASRAPRASITVKPAPPTTLVVTGLPQPDTAGAAHNVTVTRLRRLRQRGHRLHRHGPLHQQRRPGRPAGQLHLHRGRRRDAHLLRHAQDGRHPVDHRHRHGDASHHGHRDGHRGQPGRGAAR